MTMRVLFSDGDDRVSAAIARLASDGTTAVLLDAPDRAGLASRLAARRGAEPALADKLLDRPLYAALAMLAEGEADAVVTGAESHTGDVMRACELCLGRGDPARLASSSFVMDVPGRGKLVFSDCAVNPEPTVDQLATIAIAAGDAASALLGVAPRVALLSFSTHGSAHHERAARVARATELARVRRPAMAIDGELQVDAALDGRANVLVFPDLGAGNIACELVRALARAPAYGAFLHGFTRPVIKLACGATPDEIVGAVRLLQR